MVKIFFNSSHASLGEELNQWLEERGTEIEIVDVNMSSNQYGHCLAILYDEAPGPGYRGYVLFHSRHDGLEDEANAVLSDAGVFVALGSNEYGHALCVIETL